MSVLVNTLKYNDALKRLIIVIPMTQYSYIIIIVVRLLRSTFRGLDLLNQLVIYGASISILDSDLLTSTPSLKNLQVAASGLTLVPALCNTGSHLRVLNLSENALPSFDAAGVRCTGHGSGHSR